MFDEFGRYEAQDEKASWSDDFQDAPVEDDSKSHRRPFGTLQGILPKGIVWHGFVAHTGVVHRLALVHSVLLAHLEVLLETTYTRAT